MVFTDIDGSVRSLHAEPLVNASSGSESLFTPPVLRLNPAASLLSSDEYFSQFANTTLDDEAALSIAAGHAAQTAALAHASTSQRDSVDGVTHDPVFEDWARLARFDRGYLPP